MNQVLPGELMMIGFDGMEVTPALKEWVTKRHVGGVVLFSRNLLLMGPVYKLISDLQELRSKVSSLPLIVAIDQEGGVVSRLIKGTTVLPGNMVLGGIGSEDSAFAAGRIAAVEMRMLGFNVNLAPVMDLSCEPKNLIVGVRSFGEDPALVGKLGSAMIEGMQAYGMLATAKHFPGLGRCRVDPHQDLPVVPCQDKKLLQDGLKPFAAAIAAGVKIIMTAHAAFRHWEPNGVVPATLSRTLLDGVLRKQMGFGGVILSDDLEMQALTKYFSAQEIAFRGIQAGLDMFLVCHSQDRQLETFEALKQILQEDPDLAQRMEKSLKRIQEIKRRLGDVPSSEEVNVGTLGIHKELVERMGRDSITLVKDEVGMLPVRLKKSQKMILLMPRYETKAPLTQVEESARTQEEHVEPLLLTLLRCMHANVQMRQIDLSPSQEDFKFIAACGAYDLVLLLTYNAHLFPKQMEFAKQLLSKKKEVIVVAIRNPYDLAQLKDANTALATYGFQDCSMKALVDALFGDIIPKGKMPVSLDFPEE